MKFLTAGVARFIRKANNASASCSIIHVFMNNAGVDTTGGYKRVPEQLSHIYFQYITSTMATSVSTAPVARKV